MQRLFILFLVVISLQSFAQQGQQEEDNILKEIRLTNSILESYRKSERSSVYQLRLLNKNIEEQKALLQQLEKDIGSLNQAIGNVQDSLEFLQKRQRNLKEEYRQLVLFAYLNQERYQPFVFLFSAKNFNQAYKRFLYIKNYSARRKRYIGLIQETSKQLEEEKNILEQKISRKKQLVEKKQKQLEALQDEINRKKQLLADLRKNEKDVRSKLRNQIKLARELNKKISQSILNNLQPDAPSDDIDASEGFARYKGELPWPVKEGVVMSEFGKKQHPFLQNVTVNNSGIDISTLKNAPVRAVFEGKVVKLVNIPGINHSVLLKHGSYYTLYSNLKDLNVEKGDFVLSGDILGIADFDFQNEDQYYLKFQVWHKSDKLNPVKWLKEK